MKKFFYLVISLLLFNACSEISNLKILDKPSASPTNNYYNEKLAKLEAMKNTNNPTLVPTISPNENTKVIFGLSSGKWIISEDNMKNKYLYICQEDSNLIAFESFEGASDVIPEKMFNRKGNYNNFNVFIDQSNESFDTYNFELKNNSLLDGTAKFKNIIERKIKFQRIQNKINITNERGFIIKTCSSEGLNIYNNIISPISTPIETYKPIINPTLSPAEPDPYFTIYPTSTPTDYVLYQSPTPIPTIFTTPTPNLPECPSQEQIIANSLYSNNPSPIPGVNCSISKPINIPSGQCWVDSYYRTDGTYVSGYYRECPTSTPTISSGSSGRCWVNGYYRKNGTYVSGYYRDCR